jgi:hypothetical protein
MKSIIVAAAIVPLVAGVFYLHRSQHVGGVRFVDMQFDHILKSFAPLDDDMRQLGACPSNRILEGSILYTVHVIAS